MENLKYELENKVYTWVNTRFNFIELSVLEIVAEHTGDHLLEKIEQPSKRTILENLLDRVGDREELEKIACEHLDVEALDIDYLTDEDVEDLYEVIDKSDFSDVLEEIKYDSENYPLHGTCFEIRSFSDQNITNNAEQAGFGLISNLDHFNDILFVNSTGYDFYSNHWVPLYLLCYPDEKEKYCSLKKEFWKAYRGE